MMITKNIDSILSIDGGGTKTTCLIVDITTRSITKKIEGEGSNLQRFNSYSIISNLLERSIDFENFNIVGVYCGMAGASTHQDRIKFKSFLESFSFLKAVKFIIVLSDFEIGLASAKGVIEGIVVVAGTGSVIWGIHNDVQKKIGGWGYLLGDEGGSYQIGIDGLRAVCRSEDALEDKTILSKMILDKFKIQKIRDIVPIVYKGSVSDIGSIGPLVHLAASQNDKVALKIIENALEYLTSSVFLVNSFSHFFILNSWKNTSFMTRYKETIHSILPNANIILPDKEPAYGAALLAIKKIEEECL